MTLYAFLEVKVAVVSVIAAVVAAVLFARSGSSLSVAGTSLYLSNGGEVNASEFASIVYMLGGGSALSEEVRWSSSSISGCRRQRRSG